MGQNYLAKGDRNPYCFQVEYVMVILNKYKCSKQSAIFHSLSLFRFNANNKHITQLAEYTQIVGKYRNKQGIAKQQLCCITKKPFRLCDLMSSHVMRRTAITTMLMSGVPEMIIKRISGHIGNSKSFYRNVNLAQSYMDKEIDKHFELMSTHKDTEIGLK